MSDIVLALAPIFLLIVLGYGLRERRIVPDAFWPPLEKLTYFLFFPALLVDSTAKADLSGVDLVGMGGAMAGAILAVAAAVTLAKPWISANGPQFTSVFQGSIRVNTYVGLAAAGAVYGSKGTALTAVGIIAVVPLVNVLCVLVLSRWGRSEGRIDGRRDEGQGARATMAALVRNPLILSVFAGAVLNAAGVHRIPVASPLLAILGAASLPLGLLAVGAGLDLAAARRASGRVLLSATVRLLLVPLVTLIFGGLAGLEPMPLAIAVLYCGLPTATSGYILARQMGGDAVLIAGIITAQTLAAAVTLPLWLGYLAR